jgi:hypothetical protein
MWHQKISSHNQEKTHEPQSSQIQKKKTISAGKSYFFESTNPTEDMM